MTLGFLLTVEGLTSVQHIVKACLNGLEWMKSSNRFDTTQHFFRTKGKSNGSLVRFKLDLTSI